MQLSKRLTAIGEMVSPGHTVVDVGTDHAYLPIALVRSRQVPAAIAMDINEGPLNRARQNIKAHGLEQYIITRRSDGVQALAAEAADGTLIIAGMGGNLIIKILTEGRGKLAGIKEFILQPQSDISAVRAYLQQDGFLIIKENMIEEDGKFYPMMKAVRGRMDYQEPAFFQYGKLLLEAGNPVLHIYLLRQKQGLLSVMASLQDKKSQAAQKRLAEISAEAELIEKVLCRYYQSSNNNSRERRE